MNSYSNVLIALELVGNEEYLIEAALELAGEDAVIRFIHSCEAPIYPADSYLGDLPFKIREREIAAAHAQFTVLAEKYALGAEGHSFVIGRPAPEIHRAAEELGADLIVVGSYGRHGVALLLGSTANAVLHGASCDVLAVRMKEKA